MVVDEWDIRILDIIVGIETFTKETNYPISASDKLFEDLWRVFNDPNTALLVNYQHDRFAGWAMCQTDETFMDAPFGYMNKFYVMPEFRRTKAARELAKACTDWFDSHGVVQSFTSATAAIGQDKQYMNLMAKVGYYPSGAILRRGEYE